MEPDDFQIFVKPAGAECNLMCRYCYYSGKKNLYVTDYESLALLKYPLLGDGSAGSPVVLFSKFSDCLTETPLNMVFDRAGNLFVSFDNDSRILKITPDGKKSFILIAGELQNQFITFGGAGFGEDCLYMTMYHPSNLVYAVRIEDRTARSGR